MLCSGIKSLFGEKLERESEHSHSHQWRGSGDAGQVTWYECQSDATPTSIMLESETSLLKSATCV